MSSCSSCSASTIVVPTWPAPMTKTFTARRADKRMLNGKRLTVRPCRGGDDASSACSASSGRRPSFDRLRERRLLDGLRARRDRVFALGLTPLVFVVAGVIFAATAATYAEGTVRFPEAGGPRASRGTRSTSSSLRRRLGADAQLRRHDRHLGVLRPPLPLDLLGAPQREPLGHRRGRARHRRPRLPQRRRREARRRPQRLPRGRRLRDPGSCSSCSGSRSSSARRCSRKESVHGARADLVGELLSSRSQSR